MTRIPIRTFLSMAIAFAYAVPAIAQDDKAPQMTPEQQAEMEAYIKAGTPGAAHAELAKTVGSYDLAIKHWQAPGAEPVAEKGTATRTMVLGGRVMVEDMSSTMMGRRPRTSPMIVPATTSLPDRRVLCTIAVGSPSRAAKRWASFTAPRSGDTITPRSCGLAASASASKGAAERWSTREEKNPSTAAACRSTAMMRSSSPAEIRRATTPAPSGTPSRARRSWRAYPR